MFLDYTIKRYNSLNYIEKETLLNMLNKIHKNSFSSLNDMDSIYHSSKFNHGDNLFILFDNKDIVGTMGVVTNEISETKEASIENVFIDLDSIPSLGNKLQAFYTLLNECVVFCKKYNAKIIKLELIKKEINLLPLVKNGGFKAKSKSVITRNNHEEIYSLWFEKAI